MGSLGKWLVLIVALLEFLEDKNSADPQEIAVPARRNGVRGIVTISWMPMPAVQQPRLPLTPQGPAEYAQGCEQGQI